MIKLINDLWFKRRDIVSDGFDESLDYISKITKKELMKDVRLGNSGILRNQNEAI